VVEEIGKGARLAFRYPATPPEDTAEDLFFTLPPRSMAKLFRPKKPLCGQPITLSVGGTVFCCRAILMDDDSHLDLFNVIVALAPNVHTGASTIPVAGWFDDSENINTDMSAISPSDSFLAIRRVHVSIARLCRVLEREERRCQYVSLQSSQLIKIQETVRQEMDQRTKLASGANSVDASTSETTQTSKRRAHRRGLSGHTMATITAPASTQPESDHRRKTSQPQELLQYEVEQEILELLLATSPPTEHHGNLAHELVQVYHALAWNDDEFLPTPSILLSGSHGIIHINRHVAVCMEPAAGGSHILTSSEMPRSYQTLLFPHASPKEMVDSLHMASAPQRLQQLLLMVNPRKALVEISLDAALPLPVTLELAAFLVKQGACVVSSVISRKTKLACTTTTTMQARALDFIQEFGVSIFVAVSVLTSNGMALGECMSAAGGNNSHHVRNDDAAFLGREIMEQLHSTEGISPSPTEVEEVVYSMAVWLRSHQVVIGTEEYLVAISDERTSVDHSDSNASSDSWNAAVESTEQTTPHHPEEALYKEMVQELTGNVSTVALCWRYEIDPLQLHRFRSWGVLNNKLRVLMRVPCPSDDWNTRKPEQQ